VRYWFYYSTLLLFFFLWQFCEYQKRNWVEIKEEAKKQKKSPQKTRNTLSDVLSMSSFQIFKTALRAV